MSTWTISFIFAFCAFFVPASTWAMGISPSELDIGEVAIGQTFLVDVSVSRTNPKNDKKIRVLLKGDLFENNTEKKYEVILPKGERRSRIPITIDTRKHTKGSRQGKVVISEIFNSEEAKEDAVTNITTGGTSFIKAQIVEERILEHSFQGVKIQGRLLEAPHVYLSMRNTGTVPYLFDSVNIKIFDSAERVVIEEKKEAHQFSHILPRSEKVLDIRLNEGLPAGEYRAEVRVLSSGKIEYEENVQFSIFEKESGVDVFNWLQGRYVLLAFLAILFVIFIVNFIRKKHAKKN